MPVTRPARLATLTALCAAAGCALAARAADSPRFTPNEVDAHTLQLWHLDEEKPPFRNAVENGAPLAGLLNGARAGLFSLAGMDRGVSFNANVGGTPGNSDLRGAILAASPFLATGNRDNLPKGFRYFGKDGAFTYEMIVKLDILPRDSACVALGLLSMEGDDADRVFNFRIEKEGFLSFFPLPHSGSNGGGVATIPSSGPHALDLENWYHVAVTYDGNHSATNNLKLYWTRLAPGVREANCIGSGTLSGDFNGNTGDLAVGNEARSFPGNAEAEPFPGIIDEVRMSGVARHPTDYFFVPPDRRVTPERMASEAATASRPPAFDLELIDVFVDSKQVKPPAGPNPLLELGSGLHRLDFDFGFVPDQPAGGVGLHCLLEGVDERWRETERGMMLSCQILDADNLVVSQSRFQAAGRSDGWETSLEESALTSRSEPVFIPPGSRKLRISLTSGPPDTTGFFAVDDIALHAAGMRQEPLWRSGHQPYDALTTSPAGYLPGWKRGGAEPAIARLVIRQNFPAIGLVDGDQSRAGEWFTVQELPPSARKGGVFVLSWNEVFNVIDGDTRRASYVNVPPGEYTFRAMGLPAGGERAGDFLELKVLIHPPFWQRVWFFPALTACGVALVSGVIFSQHRQRAKRSMERLKLQNALERDRTRIARDMHDDLGTRVTFINLSASLAQQEIERSPENARRHLARMTESARELVVAMDDLVWAVDPTHDTLDDLASHITRLAEEMFRDSPVRCRMDIPPLLPALPLGAEFRHHVALAVKESLHNVLQHAGPCEVFLTLAFDGETLRITIRDTGVGFVISPGGKGHGLGNLSGRLREIGGTCAVESSPGMGTRVVLSCPVAKRP